MTGKDSHPQATREGKVSCCDYDHQEDGAPGEVGAQCDDGCCVVDMDSDGESRVDNGEDSFCGHREESAKKPKPRGMLHPLVCSRCLD